MNKKGEALILIVAGSFLAFNAILATVGNHINRNKALQKCESQNSNNPACKEYVKTLSHKELQEYLK